MERREGREGGLERSGAGAGGEGGVWPPGGGGRVREVSLRLDVDGEGGGEGAGGLTSGHSVVPEVADSCRDKGAAGQQ